MESNYTSYARRFNNSKIKIYSIVAVVTVVVIILLVRFNPLASNAASSTGTSKTSIRDAIATLPLNREFKFPLLDDKGEKVGEIKYVINNAELRDEIVIKGRKASAVSGRRFLVLTLKIVNDSNKTISMNTKDYVRLFTNGNENEPLSPSIHNDPVVVDAISVKPTNIGFAINENDKDIKIKVGEIKGEKTTVDLKF